jgi:hypothetical protein
MALACVRFFLHEIQTSATRPESPGLYNDSDKDDNAIGLGDREEALQDEAITRGN